MSRRQSSNEILKEYMVQYITRDIIMFINTYNRGKLVQVTVDFHTKKIIRNNTQLHRFFYLNDLIVLPI